MRGRMALQSTSREMSFAKVIGVRTRSRAAFCYDSSVKQQRSIDATIYGVLISGRHYALPQMRVA
jgi:hypothetical protein